MTQSSLEEFLHDFRQEILADAEANLAFLEAEFTQSFADELVDSGVVDGFELCHYKAPTGMRVDGYWFNEGDACLDLFITDFANREELSSLTQTEVKQIFKRLENFFIASANKKLFSSLEETSQGYGLSRQIAERRNTYNKINLFLISERALSERLQALEDKESDQWTFTYHIWDISRLHRLRTSKGSREELELDLVEMIGEGLPCLPAHISSASYGSYLIVMPATILADLYGRYGSRLLEQNVRSFLQARGKVNKGLRETITNDPEMFFAYNNGITATAKEVQTEEQGNGTYITHLKDLQIVNGGQTTASLFHTRRKDKASLDNIFVQMKLSVVDEEKSEEIVPRISEYANTQNRVNAADFFSNHPYHVRMEEFSRRIWAPAKAGEQRETKWFYERARGQYADAQSKVTPAEKKRFQAEYSKPQMFTKTDLAKFENVWDENPRFVNLGAQKNFAQYAKRIGQEWDKTPDKFNEFYFKRAMARALLFRKTEKMVSAQPWYSGGYRANIVAYTLALIGHYCAQNKKAVNFIKIWDKQDISDAFMTALERTSKIVYDDLVTPPEGISNVTEWAKKEGCWLRVKGKTDELDRILPDSFKAELVEQDQVAEEKKSARQTQKIDNGIEAQKKVMEISGSEWQKLLNQGQQKGLLSPKETGILQIAAQIPRKIPSEKQSMVLVEFLNKAEQEGIVVNE
ncbi:AIPR protein [Nitrosomonas aestuarii]|uniref:AIPR protein n=1 Tax=Nitrosomonas aestuarii TaxID=52441 RepID=A0A1I4B9K4_9PROT|nr:AIPR family protein [Nitrosomonas aestuarii]SFK64797.1 AIPR protein [Nitrosomonas aestuarii]